MNWTNSTYSRENIINRDQLTLAVNHVGDIHVDNCSAYADDFILLSVVQLHNFSYA